MKRVSFVSLLMIAAVLAGVLAACAAPPAASGPQIKVDGVWGRPSPMMTNAGAFYMMISNSGTEADKLVSGQSPSCGTVELHEFVQERRRHDGHAPGRRRLYRDPGRRPG